MPVDDADPTLRATPWWQTGVLYQIYPLSFDDSNADGYGNLQGIADHIDHLASRRSPRRKVSGPGRAARVTA